MDRQTDRAPDFSGVRSHNQNLRTSSLPLKGLGCRKDGGQSQPRSEEGEWEGEEGRAKGRQRTGLGTTPSSKEVALKACPPSLPITHCGSPLPGCLQVAPALCSCSRRRGFERADSEYTDKLQHYTSGHSTYPPWGPPLPFPWRPCQLLPPLLLLILLLQDLLVFKYICVCVSV